MEADYFGLEYTSSEKVKYWLDLEKPMNRQLELSLTDPLLRFAVKFYAPDPAQLEEEFTRYLFCMQSRTLRMAPYSATTRLPLSSRPTWFRVRPRLLDIHDVSETHNLIIC